MPKINTEVQAEPPFFAGLLGEITGAESIKTSVSGWEGVRCKVEEIGTGDEYVEMLWIRGFVGAKSKLGAFIQALGDNTDNWVGKTIRVINWKDKDRSIEVVQKPVKKTVTEPVTETVTITDKDVGKLSDLAMEQKAQEEPDTSKHVVTSKRGKSPS